MPARAKVNGWVFIPKCPPYPNYLDSTFSRIIVFRRRGILNARRVSYKFSIFREENRRERNIKRDSKEKEIGNIEKI